MKLTASRFLLFSLVIFLLAVTPSSAQVVNGNFTLYLQNWTSSGSASTTSSPTYCDGVNIIAPAASISANDDIDDGLTKGSISQAVSFPSNAQLTFKVRSISSTGGSTRPYIRLYFYVDGVYVGQLYSSNSALSSISTVSLNLSSYSSGLHTIKFESYVSRGGASWGSGSIFMDNIVILGDYSPSYPSTPDYLDFDESGYISTDHPSVHLIVPYEDQSHRQLGWWSDGYFDTEFYYVNNYIGIDVYDCNYTSEEYEDSGLLWSSYIYNSSVPVGADGYSVINQHLNMTLWGSSKDTLYATAKYYSDYYRMVWYWGGTFPYKFPSFTFVPDHTDVDLIGEAHAAILDQSNRTTPTIELPSDPIQNPYVPDVPGGNVSDDLPDEGDSDNDDIPDEDDPYDDDRDGDNLPDDEDNDDDGDGIGDEDDPGSDLPQVPGPIVDPTQPGLNVTNITVYIPTNNSTGTQIPIVTGNNSTLGNEYLTGYYRVVDGTFTKLNNSVGGVVTTVIGPIAYITSLITGIATYTVETFTWAASLLSGLTYFLGICMAAFPAEVKSFFLFCVCLAAVLFIAFGGR